ncbi:MAG TPA: hypothetical protein VNQ90_03015 [Chthoniobacteraceae bacterium]|nr:hypothetical protein [Chthoniobacteraceae bacterium]
MSNTLAVRAALKSGAGAAENQLALIAAEQGDRQIAAIVAEFEPTEIAVMVSDTDMSKPSLVHAFVSPEQFIAAFSRLGARWGQIDGGIDYVSFQRDVEDFLCPMILSSDSTERRTAMLSAFMEHELANETLLFLTLGSKEAADLLARPHGYPFVRNTWQELLALVYEHHAAAFHEITALARELEPAGAEGAHRFAHSLLTALYAEASEHQTTETVEEEEFVDI